VTEARRAALVAELVRKLRARESWAGETHVQKTSYFLQELLGVPLGLRFTLYKYGPFSFELRDLLTQMRGLDQLEVEPQPRPYGPKLAIGEGADQLRTRFPKTLSRYDDALELVVRETGTLGVASLERLATALMVTKEQPDAGSGARALTLTEYKPHISMEQARAAVAEVDRLAELVSIAPVA
jgi:hypothetical protein